MNKQRKHLSVIIGCIVLIVTAGDTSVIPATLSRNEAVIRVDVNSNVGSVNKRVLGNNLLAYQMSYPLYSDKGVGIWDSENNRSVSEMVRLAREAGVSTVRWPGGCATHEFNWKLAVGPLSSRPKQAFGLPEFMRIAEEIGAEPIITLADYWGDAADAADLVEYLNAPLGENPNGGVDWASIRAADGHPSPYGVIWFEFGNETYHGPHSGFGWHATKTDGFTPEQYAERYRLYRTAMRSVDPQIRLGVVLATADLSSARSRWSHVVMKETGQIADYFIHHAYPGSYTREDGIPEASDLYRIAFAAAPSLALRYRELNRDIVAITGRAVPLAITEYNGGFVQNKPTPYRLSLGTAVLVADLIQVLLMPENNIAHAQYWHLSNDYWGMVKGYEQPYLLRPAYFVFKMYHDHLGDHLLNVSAQSDRYEENGGYGVFPARGDGARFELQGMPQVVLPKWRNSRVVGAIADISNAGVLEVNFTGNERVNYYHSKIRLPAEPLTGYRVTAELRAEGLNTRGAQLQVVDARGWNATKSEASSDEVTTSGWTKVAVDYVTLPDSREIEIIARRLDHSPERGRFWIRNITIQRYRETVLPSVPFVSAIATKKQDSVSVFVLNRRINASSPVRIVVPQAVAVNAWVLSGSTVDATNEVDANNVQVKELPVSMKEGMVLAGLPPHSFAVFDVKLRASAKGDRPKHNVME